MSKIIQYLFILIISKNSFSQNHEDGPWVSYNSSGQIVEKGNYKNNHKIGEWIKYFPNGQINEIGSYYNGKRGGKWMFYDYNGGLLYEENYIKYEDIQPGYDFAYFDNGQLAYIGKILNGVREGEWISYYEDGNLKYKGNYKNGKRDGEWIAFNSFNPGGDSFDFKGRYENGKRVGEWSEKIPDRGIESGQYVNDYREGEWITNNEHNSYYKGNYVKGIPVGKWIKFENNIEISKDVKELRENKIWQKYYKSGKLEEKGVYVNDSPLIEYSYYRESGMLLEKGMYLFGKREGEWVGLASKGRYSNGQSEGEWITYHPNGKICSKILNHRHRKIRQTSYDENGNLDISITSPDDCYYGYKEIIVYSKNGQIYKKSCYIDGIELKNISIFKEGKWIKYDLNGQILQNGDSEIKENGN